MSIATDYDEDLDGPITTIDNKDTATNVTQINPLDGKPRRPKRQSSFAATVADLDVGEMASRVHHLNQEMTLADFERDLREMKSMVDNNVRPAIVSAKKITGGEYRTEVCQTFSTAGRIYLVAVVTRLS